MRSRAVGIDKTMKQLKSNRRGCCPLVNFRIRSTSEVQSPDDDDETAPSQVQAGSGPQAGPSKKVVIKVKMMIRNQTLGWPWQQNS